MKIQQISRFRLGDQGKDAGYQISGASAQVDSAMESEFTGMYTTLELGNEPGTMLPYILDGGYNIDGSRFYLTQIYAEKDFKSRPTPYVHGLIFDQEQMADCYNDPGDFFRFSRENFRESCNPQQQKRELLPEISELRKKNIPPLTVQEIREKYRLTDEVYEDLLRHFYEAVFSEGMTTLAFGWNQSMNTFEEVIKDMMFLAFSSMPEVLRRKITFSNYQIKGMTGRMFTVLPEKYCENHKGAWFNLADGHSSQLQEDIEGTRFKTQFITYLASNSPEESKRFLNYVDRYLRKIYRHPEMKLVTAIANAMIPAFYTYGYETMLRDEDAKILETYFKPVNAGRILNSLTRVKVDEPAYISDLLAVLLEKAIGMHARINDVQFKNLQKYYLETDSQQYEKAFIAALASRDQETVKKLFSESLKEKSSLKTDNFIAGLLNRISNRQTILTEEVIQAIADRYPITESEDLQDFYLDYVNGLYTETMSREEASKLIKKALGFIQDNQNKPSYERAAIYLERQLEQLVKYRLVLESSVLEQLLQICVDYGNDYGIGESILAYYMQVYMNGDLGEAVKYYGYLQKYNRAIRMEIDERLRKENSRVQDEYYCTSILPSLTRREVLIMPKEKLETPSDYRRELIKICDFPVFEHSYQKITAYYKNQAELYMRRRFGQEEDDRQEHGVDSGTLLLRYRELKKRTQEIFGRESEAALRIQQRISEDRLQQVKAPEAVCESILNALLESYWEVVDVNTISPKFFSDHEKEICCAHEKYVKQERYYQARRKFRQNLQEDPGYRPDIETLLVLTTTECVERMELVDERIKRIVSRQEFSDSELSVDVLLTKYYDFVKESFIDTDFLKNLTEDQKYELMERDYHLAAVHPELPEKLQKYLKEKKKKAKKGQTGEKKGLKEFLYEKRIFFLAGTGILLATAAVILAVVLMMGKSGKNDSQENESVIGTSSMEKQTDNRNPDERNRTGDDSENRKETGDYLPNGGSERE